MDVKDQNKKSSLRKPSSATLQSITLRIATTFAGSLASSGSDENFFVDVSKKRAQKAQKFNTGFEYDHDVRTDDDFIQKIIKSNCYNPTSENTIDFDDELRRVIVTLAYPTIDNNFHYLLQNMSQTTDKRNVGSIIGATLFGLAGFLLLSFTLIGALAGKKCEVITLS